MQKKSVILFGSSRSDGNTRKVVDELLGAFSFPLHDLSDFTITPFDYAHRNIGDDFIPLIEDLLNYDTLIIATPVYWYQMSAQHKIFFDRISDLLSVRKDLGRKLRGKQLFVVASFGTSYPRSFEETFEDICTYLGIEYLGSSFIYSGEENAQFLQNNAFHIAKMQEALGLVPSSS